MYSAFSSIDHKPGEHERVRVVAVSRLHGSLAAVSHHRDRSCRNRENRIVRLENVETRGLASFSTFPTAGLGLFILSLYISCVPRERLSFSAQEPVLSSGIAVRERGNKIHAGNRLRDPLGATRTTRDGSKRLSYIVLRFLINLSSLIMRRITLTAVIFYRTAIFHDAAAAANAYLAGSP